jgi:hypothetical protein
MLLAASAAAQELGPDIRRSGAERDRTHREFMELVQRLEMKQKLTLPAASDDSEMDLSSTQVFEVVSRAPAAAVDEAVTFFNDFRIILIPKYPRPPIHNQKL